jgi:hypothetical protein
MTTSAARPPSPASQGLHYSFEKAGLTLDREPIPWNAEAVTVEAVVGGAALSATSVREFTLALPNHPLLRAETFRAGSAGKSHVFFRLAVPAQTAPAEVRWRDRSLGQINLPILSQAEFLAGLKVSEPTMHVRLKDDAHACRAYVSTQAKEVLASMLLTSPTSLAPLADLTLAATIVSRNKVLARRVVNLESTQLAARQALVVVPFSKPRGAVKDWDIRWMVGDDIYAARTIRFYRAADFHKSLRISTTRLYLEGPGGVLPLARFAPETWDGITRLGPVFLVSSGIAGMAAQAEFRIRALDRAGRTMLEMPPVKALVTDGPTAIAPGTLGRDDDIDGFELWCGPRRLGELTLAKTPTAVFTGEGGIAAGRDNYAWSPEAEEQLQQKLGQLFGGA